MKRVSDDALPCISTSPCGRFNIILTDTSFREIVHHTNRSSIIVAYATSEAILKRDFFCICETYYYHFDWPFF